MGLNRFIMAALRAFALCATALALLANPVHAQQTAQTSPTSAPLVALPSLNCAEFKQTVQQTYTMLTNGTSFEVIYQTITPANPTLRQKRLSLGALGYTGTQHINERKNLAVILDTIEQNCGAKYAFAFEKDLNQQCALYAFSVDMTVQFRDAGKATTPDEIPIRFNYPMNPLNEQSVPLGQFFMHTNYDQIIKPLMQTVFDHPEKNSSQLIEELNAQCLLLTE